MQENIWGYFKINDEDFSLKEIYEITGILRYLDLYFIEDDNSYNTIITINNKEALEIIEDYKKRFIKRFKTGFQFNKE